MMNQLLIELDTLLKSEGYQHAKIEWQRLRTKHEDQLADLKSRQRLERLRFEVDKSEQYEEWRRVRKLSDEIQSLLFARHADAVSDSDESQLVSLLASVHEHLVVLLGELGGK